MAGRQVDRSNAELKRLVDDTGHGGSFHLLGECHEVSNLTPAFDLLCSTSVSEGFPNVVAEAMASGVPCVATDVGDTQRIIEDTGRLVPAGDPAALCAACDVSLDESPERRGERAREARRRIEEHFSLETTARRFASLWR